MELRSILKTLASNLFGFLASLLVCQERVFDESNKIPIIYFLPQGSS
jgi:hypothetical protein